MPIRLLTGDQKIEDDAAARAWIESHTTPDGDPQAACPPFWLDIIEPDLPAIDWLAEQFRFHPLTIEDLKSPNERGKLETYDSYLFLIVHAVDVENVPPATRGTNPAQAGRVEPRHLPHPGHQHPQPTTSAEQSGPKPTANPICEIDSHELHAYLSQNYLITVHDPKMRPAEKVWAHTNDRSPTGERHPMAHGVDFLLYRLLDNTADTYFAALEVTADQIDFLEDSVVERPDRQLLEDVFVIKRNLMTIRRQATPMREALNILSNPGTPFVQEANSLFLRDVHSLLVAVYESADSQRDSAGGVLDAYLSSVNNNLSLVMKRMTIIATIFMPISFIVGFGGMNFTSFIPYDSRLMFWGLMASLVLTPIGMLLWFYRSRWF
ncbi:MAG: magnesium transporter CorA family protein [Chloroflexota bacterium]|nr:magnesium transporter CorA family protein [Chloroflexota bacterium]